MAPSLRRVLDMKSALLVGASGLVGKELLKLLIESSDYDKVKALVRRHISIDHPKLEQDKGTNIYPSDQIEELNPQKQESAQYI